MLGGCVLHEIQLLGSFEVADKTTVERLVKMLLQMHVETSFCFEDFITLRTLLLDCFRRNVF